MAIASLVQLAAESANSKAASFYVLDEAEQVLKPFMTFGLPQQFVDGCGVIPVGEQCCGRAVQHLKPWIVSNMLSDPLFASAKQTSLESGITAGFSVPVIDERNKCIGALGCHYATVYTPTDDDIKRNLQWAKLIAHAVSTYRRSTEGLTAS
jgi:GAF domain-containing protein